MPVQYFVPVLILDSLLCMVDASILTNSSCALFLLVSGPWLPFDIKLSTVTQI